MNDFAGSDATIRSPSILTIFTAGLRIDTVWNQRCMIEQLFGKVISPTNEMLRMEFDQYSEFYLPFTELLIEVLVKKMHILQTIDGGPIEFIFQALITQIAFACPARSLLISRLSAVFIAIEHTHGTEAVIPVMAEFAIPVLEGIFKLIFKPERGIDLLALTSAIHVILSHDFMKRNPADFCDLLFRIAQNCRPELAQSLIVHAYDDVNSVAFLETLRTMMLEVRLIRPGQSLEMFGRARLEVMEALKEMIRERKIKEEEESKQELMSEITGITEQLRGFSVELC
jgi:hypothetical protein